MEQKNLKSVDGKEPIKTLTGIERKNLNMNEKPSFFYDNSEKDEAELLLDFYLSFTLRCAIDNHPAIPPLVNEYSKKILFLLLNEEIANKNLIEVIEVRTWKQWERIDLIAEIDLKIDDKPISFVLVFENKLYTITHSNQLKKYKEVTENSYRNHPQKNHYKIFYYYLTCMDEIPEKDLVECKKQGFKTLTFQDLRDSINTDKRTGDTLFDEFWFRYY